MSILQKQALNEFKAKFHHLEESWGIDDITQKEGLLKEIAKEKENRLKEYAKVDSTVYPIINTALVINWKWETAKKRIDRFYKLFPYLDTLQKLNTEIENKNPVTFCKKFLQINATSERNPKYQLLSNLCKGFLLYKETHKFSTEREALIHWANNVDLYKLKNDPIGRLPGVGPGVVQNLRMMMGVDVVKPDRHVINVLGSEFGISIDFNQFNDLARELGLSPTYLDKVLYEYGRKK